MQNSVKWQKGAFTTLLSILMQTFWLCGFVHYRCDECEYLWIIYSDEKSRIINATTATDPTLNCSNLKPCYKNVVTII